MKTTRDLFTIILAAMGLLFSAWPAPADQYSGNGDTGFGGAIGNGTLTLTDDGTNISGTLTTGGSMDDVLVLYIQTGPGGFADTSGFNDQQDACRQAISGVSALGRSLLTFTSGFQPNYALALAPAAAGTGGLWQLANGGSNSLVYLGSVNLAPLDNSGPYSFSFPAALIGLIPGVRSTMQILGTYVACTGSRSTEAIAGNLTGTQGCNPFSQTDYASYIFDAGAVLVKLPLGVWAQHSRSPTGRVSHTAVWTGSEMIVWGGDYYNGGYRYLNDGARYDPAANTWTMLPTSGESAARSMHTVVWTGTEMIVWGGQGGSGYFNDGGRYNPAANTWTALPTTGAPAAREYHAAVWTGRDMIIWGGANNSGPFNDGARYNPEANSWTALPTTGAPAARNSHTAVWTGSEMIVWGGISNATYYANGGRYNPVADSWTVLPAPGAPVARSQHTALWTGSEMIVWGGYSNTVYYANGARYNPTADSWTAVPNGLPSAPAGRRLYTAVWTGSDMVVWGGFNGSYLNSGGRYNPVANTWTALPTAGAPAARSAHSAVWTGSEMIVWGGYCFSGSSICFNNGGRYNPAANSWTAVLVTPVPVARCSHTAVWTGSEMIIWGGCNGTVSPGYFNDGGRYNPAANTWTALPASGAPLARDDHTAVWTGSEMIIWGGSASSYFNDGGRYNPVANTWTALPTAGAPASRFWHTAVWTGGEMIVWGGWDWNSDFDDGGRYNPTTDSWVALPTNGAPAARDSHTAVWTGSEMIVWGGEGGSGFLNDGGRYNPTADNWVVLPTNGAPTARDEHTAVWTGSEMIVWGGGSSTSLSDGGRFNPAANSWVALPTNGAPAARSLHTAVWTGSEMIVWGGGNSDYLSDTWSYYPYAPAVRISPSGPASALVAWPVWSSILRLCQTTNLTSGQWATVTNPVTQVGSENHVTLSPLTGSQFFRAEYP